MFLGERGDECCATAEINDYETLDKGCPDNAPCAKLSPPPCLHEGQGAASRAHGAGGWGTTGDKGQTLARGVVTNCLYTLYNCTSF